jgi:hypothetical protein
MAGAIGLRHSPPANELQANQTPSLQDSDPHEDRVSVKGALNLELL